VSPYGGEPIERTAERRDAVMTTIAGVATMSTVATTAIQTKRPSYARRRR